MTVSEILANASKLGVRELTPMQKAMAELPREVSAVALIAPTGSGKTLAFALAMLRRPGRALVIAPTRELVLQIAKVLSALAPEKRTVALYGGHSVLDETRSLEAAEPDIVVGTPGRILDHIHRGRLDVAGVRTLVADEYDKSLELGFHDEMRKIITRIRRPELIVLTSATALNELPEWLGVRKLHTLDFSAQSTEAAPQLERFNVRSPEADKLEALRGLLLRLPRERTIVFVNHRESAERVAEFLKKKGFPVALYHGALDQQERETAVDLFTNGTAPVLVATDLAARGLDIPQVASVIHYHLPLQPEVLVHRNGRAGRMGATGSVYYLLGPQEQSPDPDAVDMPERPSVESWPRELATLYFHAGRREKLSKGDIVGALTGPGGLRGDQVGAIALHDHRALVAVPAAEAQRVVAALGSARIKNRKIRVTPLR